MSYVQQLKIEAGMAFAPALLPPPCTDLNGLTPGIQELRFRREHLSHRGISAFRNLRRLWLYAVNQELLNEACCLPRLETLYIDGLTARNLSPLAKLPKLRRLIINGGTNVESLDWARPLVHLEVFAIENFKRVDCLDALASLTRLHSLGVEGSMWTAMQVKSLEPLAHLRRLRYLFLSNLTTADATLGHLHNLTDLQFLQCGAAFPVSEFVRLRMALPALRCDWFEILSRYARATSALQDSLPQNPADRHFALD